jgi:orotate phosphoribosyltransferase
MFSDDHDATSQLLTELPIRKGHFVLESGYHTNIWLTLDALFREPGVVAPMVRELAEQLRPYDVTAICGPMSGGAFLAQALANVMQVRFYYATLEAERTSDRLFNARYQLPVELQRTAHEERFVVVDDAISAGSSVRATIVALQAARAEVIAVGTLLLLGDAARQHFARAQLPLLAVAQHDLNLWQPTDCPLCVAGSRAEDPTRVD